MSLDRPGGSAVPWETPPSPGRARNMAAIRRTDTKPEVTLRSALHRLGLRFRKDYRLLVEGVYVRPDIVFTRQRVAVFVDGCFWHACPEHGRRPSKNQAYWGPKLQRTVDRDARATTALTAAGWTVVRVWEHVAHEEAVDLVVRSVAERRSPDR